MRNNLSDNFRKTTGLDKVKFGTKPNDIVGFNYIIELKNASKTQKRIFDKSEYQIGQIILDVQTAINAEVLSKEAVKVRDLK